MKNYILLYEGGDPDWQSKTSPEELGKEMAKWEAWMTALSEKGQLVSGGDPLHYSGVRVSPGGIVSDIASAEMKDIVSGYSIVSANNQDEAVAISKTCPVLSDPTVNIQVREIMTM